MRPGITWMIVGAVAVIVLFAGLDALRSAGGEPTPPEASATTVTTTRTETGVEIESSASLVDEQLVRLIPGRVRTDRDWPAFDSFTVPRGWYGHQRGAGYVIGNELNDQAVIWRSGGISVGALGNRFSPSLADAARAFEKLREIRIEHVSPVRIGGNSGRRYDFVVDRSVSLRPLGANATLWPGQPDVILLDVPGDDTNTLIIRWGFDDDPERAEVERVLMSLEFYRPPPPKKEIEQTANGWASLFAAGQRCNRFMHQPACEWVDCKRPGGEQIENCTPVSSEVQRSFAGAVVQDIAISGKWAAARFSNGETVRFVVAFGGEFWWIDRVGAGRKLFE
jgi:hypothetical protein